MIANTFLLLSYANAYYSYFKAKWSDPGYLY